MTQPASDQQTSKTSRKHAVQKQEPSVGSRLTWSEVSRALDEDETVRALVLRLYREGLRGCASEWVSPPPDDPRVWTPDDFAHRNEARRCMADALTWAEDALDLAKRTPRREALASTLRDLRRRLEIELYP